MMGALVSRRVNRACSSGIAMPIARKIIGRSTKQIVNNVPPSYAMRRYSRTLRPRKNVQFVSYQCPKNWYAVSLFHPRLLCPCQLASMEANEELVNKATEVYYECCGKSICKGCIHSFAVSGNMGKCPYCNARTGGKTNEDMIKDLMKRVEANDAGAISALADCYHHGQLGLLQDRTKASLLGVCSVWFR
jgi:hypothetical protein